jgi:hypothetical protein
MVTLVDNEIGCIKGETHPELGLVVHVDIYKWDKESFKQAQKIWMDFVDMCQHKGIETIFAGIPKTDKKNEQFALMFGFEPTDFDLANTEGEYLMSLWAYPITE